MDKDFSTGQRIKFRRKQLSISAEKLASIIGVSPATVYRWEKGEIEKVSSAIINPLADALHTTPAFLMGWNDDPDSVIEDTKSVVHLQTSEARILAKGFDQMPEAERKRALDMAKLIFEKYADLFEQKE